MRVGVIGTGWGRMHIGAFRGAGADVVALCGRDLAKTRAIAAAEGVSMATDSVFELCAAVDVVVVASTDRLHLDHVRAAIERGRGVLCEKPLCLNLDQARAMVRLAASARAPCAVSFPYRQLAPLRALRRALQERTPLRELDVVVRNAFLRPRPFATSGGDPSGDLGGASHVVDAALWFAGSEPLWVQSSVDRDAHSALSLYIQLRSGARLSLVHRPTCEPGIHGHWALAGDGWEVGFFAGYQPGRGGWCVSAPRVTMGSGWEDLAAALEPLAGQPEPWAQAHVEGARCFLDGARRHELATFGEGAIVQAVLDAALRASETGLRTAVEPVLLEEAPR